MSISTQAVKKQHTPPTPIPYLPNNVLGMIGRRVGDNVMRTVSKSFAQGLSLIHI